MILLLSLMITATSADTTMEEAVKQLYPSTHTGPQKGANFLAKISQDIAMYDRGV